MGPKQEGAGGKRLTSYCLSRGRGHGDMFRVPNKKGLELRVNFTLCKIYSYLQPLLVWDMGLTYYN